MGGANSGIYANYKGSSKWSEHVKAARASGSQVDHYWFNGRAGTVNEQIDAILGTYDGVKIEADEDLWWDVEDEGYTDKVTGKYIVTTKAWSPSEVVVYAQALAKRGVPIERQGIYLNSGATKDQDWSPVVALGMRLWVADYGTNDGNVSSKPLVGYWKDVHLFQYTSRGHLPGYEGYLDLNIDGKDVWTVYDLQIALSKVLGIDLVADGDFGPNTRTAVEKFQKLKALVVDGDPGWNTLTALEKALSSVA